MHWGIVILTVFLVALLLSLLVLIAVMFTNHPSDLEDLSADVDFAEIRAGHSQGGYNLVGGELTVEGDGSASGTLVGSTFDTGALELELRGILAGGVDGAGEEGDVPQRAGRLLSAVTHSTQRSLMRGPNASAGDGDGVVVCAGGFKYGTCAYVLLRELRAAGCHLPVEVWHFNDEMSDEMKGAFEALGGGDCGDVTVRNIEQVASINIHGRFAVKPLAVFYSAFRRVLLLDADMVPVADPTPLFEHLSDSAPALFWPDHWHLDRKAKCWETLSDVQQERMTFAFSQDGGQVLLDKRHCTNALNLCCKINVQLHAHLGRLFPKPMNESDNDTWTFSWLATDTPFGMISHRAGGAGARDDSGQYVGSTLVQHAPDGQAAFLHTRGAKWAMQTERPQWTDVYKFMNKSRGHVHRWTSRFENGPVTRQLFSEAFGDLEDRCWEYLNDIRGREWYRTQYTKQMQDIGIP